LRAAAAPRRAGLLVLATFAHHPGTVGPDVWDAPLLLS
jgi:hypothetical protein